MSNDYVANENISAFNPEEVFSHLHTRESGLTEQEVKDRLISYGENTIKSKKSFHPVRRFTMQLVNLFALMLWVASILALISGTPILSYVIWFIIMVNAVFSFIQERKADKALQALARMIPNNVKVIRNSEISVISATNLVPGDVIIVAAGDKVPADVRIVAADGLFVDNSMVTGESIPVDRDAAADPVDGKSIVNSHNLLFAGTTITGGDATCIVYATGKRTQIGNITQTSSEIVRRKSTLEFQIQKITKTLMIIAVILGIIAFFISSFITGIHINAALIFAIGIIVANIPEGLMPTVSLSLAMGMQRLAKKNALVRKQSAVETLSSTSVICTDKTGTLTQNIIFAKKIWTADGIVRITGEGYGKQGTIIGATEANHQTLEKIFTAATICSDTVIQTDKDDENKWKVIGDPTEAAILIAAQKYGLSVENITSQFNRLKVIPFSSTTKTMTVIAGQNHHPLQFTKGDPDKIIDHCSFIFKNGQVSPMLSTEKEQIHAVKDEMSSEGYRILAIAYNDQIENSEPTSNDLILLGLVVMYDPPKAGVQQAIADCYRAGIKVTVVTGDYSLTAAAIAKQIGIIKDQYITITGAELENMSKQDLAKKIDTDIPVIFARTTPKEKLKIVEAYQELGHVVASTGDGLNDVLALRKADIGISMGKNGSDAAIESSDVVLLDDNFATIVEAVKEGRAIYNNIQKFITYILASNIPEVFPFLIMGFFNIPLALTVLLVISIDLGTDLVPAISLGEEIPDEGVLDTPPRDPNSNILNKNVLLRAYAYLGVIEGLIMYVVYFLTWHHFGYTIADIRSFTTLIADGTASEEIMHVYRYAITMAFGAVIACQIGNILECRSSRQPFYKSLKKKNNLMVWGILLEIVLFLLIAYVPFIQMLFETTAPKPEHLTLLLLCPIGLIIFEEVRKWIVRRT
ncbi:cation-translocating P-type ATPase [Schinkia sp. CFF1]